MKQELKDVLTGLSAIIIYLLFKYVFFFFSVLLNINPDKLSNTGKVIYNLSFELILLSIIVFIYHKTLKEHLKKFKKCHFIKYIRYWFIALLLMTISNSLIDIFTHLKTASNQQVVENNLFSNPLPTIFIVVLIAPLLEELVYRLSFRKIFKTDTIFIILSGLFFGLMHMYNPSTLLEFIYIIPYSIPGFIFAYTLKKSKNIFVPVGLHMIHNGSMVLLQLFLLLK